MGLRCKVSGFIKAEFATVYAVAIVFLVVAGMVLAGSFPEVVNRVIAMPVAGVSILAVMCGWYPAAGNAVNN